MFVGSNGSRKCSFQDTEMQVSRNSVSANSSLFYCWGPRLSHLKLRRSVDSVKVKGVQIHLSDVNLDLAHTGDLPLGPSLLS